MGKLLFSFLIAVAAIGWNVFNSLDMGRSLYNHRPGICRRVNGPVKGSEDIEFIREKEIAFVTSGILYLQPHRKDVEGKIFLYDFNQKTEKLVAKELAIKGKSFDKNNFHPHGITHWIVDNRIRLYVVNHNDEFKHSIEVFDYDSSESVLHHKKSITDPSFIRPNDLVALGPDQLIFTNDGVAQTELMNAIEFLSGYKAGSVFYWDGKKSHQLLSAKGGPNGIAYDHKNKKLFVSEINFKRMHAYDLSKDRKSLTLLSTIDLFSACDNFFIDADGSVYTGCHPIFHEAAKSFAECDGKVTSSSQVLRIKFDNSYKTASITEPYANDGSEVSGSSIAMVYNNQMLIGTVCKGLLHCEISHPSVL